MTFMQNRFVHHLISTKLHCAPPKCTSVQNYIVNLDLHIHSQPPTLWPVKYRQWTKSVCFMHVPCAPQKKMLRTTPTSHGCRFPLCTMVRNAGQWCTTQAGGAQHSPVPMKWCTTSFHKLLQPNSQLAGHSKIQTWIHHKKDGFIFTTFLFDA